MLSLSDAWWIVQRHKINTRILPCPVRIPLPPPEWVLPVTWISSLFAGTRTALAPMPDWDTLDYGIQHQVPAHWPFAISSNIFHCASFSLQAAAWVRTQHTTRSVYCVCDLFFSFFFNTFWTECHVITALLPEKIQQWREYLEELTSSGCGISLSWRAPLLNFSWFLFCSLILQCSSHNFALLWLNQSTDQVNIWKKSNK